MTGQTYDYKPKFPEVLKMSENKIPYAELDRPIDIPVLEDNTTVGMGNMYWHFHREQPFTWLQIRMLRFCLGLTVSKNGS